MSRLKRARAAVLAGAAAVGLAGPTALAFFAGGYFDEARAWAGLMAWVLVALAAALERPRVPSGRGAWLAIGGLVALTAWTLASIAWAPIAGNAYHAGQVAVLYAGGLLASVLLLRGGAAQRAVEPALAAGALVVIAYALSERLLPGLLHFARSLSAQGRLEQPLTYWNAMGELAAIGFVLCVRISGSAGRGRPLRLAATAAAVPLGVGLYLSFSRGALFACLAGLVALIVAAGSRVQLLCAAVCAGAAVVCSLALAPLGGVTSLRGSLGTREWQGAVALAVMVVVMGAATAVITRLLRRERPAALKLPARAPWIATGVICAGLALAIVIGAKEGTSASLGGGASRLATFQSNRYAYWGVALRAFAHEPIRGVGAGGWPVWWLRYRTVNDFAQDAHSLPLQTLAELGLVGLALLAVFLAGLALAARDALARSKAAAAGPLAGLVVWVAHAPLDWDWQMPAVTLIAIVLAGALLALTGSARAQTASGA